MPNTKTIVKGTQLSLASDQDVVGFDPDSKNIMQSCREIQQKEHGRHLVEAAEEEMNKEIRKE